ncbi:regulator of G-protein signaling 3-like [Polymixia lowei]
MSSDLFCPIGPVTELPSTLTRRPIIQLRRSWTTGTSRRTSSQRRASLVRVAAEAREGLDEERFSSMQREEQEAAPTTRGSSLGRNAELGPRRRRRRKKIQPSVVRGRGTPDSMLVKPDTDSPGPTGTRTTRTSTKPTQSPELAVTSANHNLSTLLFNTDYYNATARTGTQNHTQNLTVSIVRGSDGFGFTICSDSPVRVQAVEPGGPAQRSGLLQSDFVLQLNGVPVESWRCIDLAHAIRNCSTQIVLVVWRILPDMKQQFEGLVHQPSYQPPDPQQNPTHTTTTVRKLLPHPPNSKHGRRRGQGSEGSSGGRSGLGALGSLWRDRKEERGEEVSDFSPCTTLKGTRVTSSNGDDYIILSPVNPGSQPVYQDRMGTVGRLYQTHPSRGLHQQNQHLLHDPPPGSLRQPFSTHTATLPPPSSSSPSSAQPGNYGNYQNCTMVQSHLPCSGYGTYVTLAPKTLIFPMFVQPLELCSPDRTLLMSEEMILHKGDLLPIKVTVLIYSDLLLLSREDEAGRCNVLQSPLYLHTIRLHHVPSRGDPVRLGSPLSGPDRSPIQTLLSLFLNIPEVSGARGFLPLPHPSLLLEPSPSPEEEQQDDSDEDDEEEEGGVEYSSSFRRRAPPSLQRSLSEGSLLQEPRSPCFLSDSTIHRLTRPMTFNPDHTPCPSSPQTLRRELTREGGSLQQMFHFLYGRKDSEFRNISQKRTTSLAAEVRSRLAFLRRRRNNLHDNSLEKALRNTRPSPGEVLRWAESFDALLTNKYGLAVFRHFLRSEFSEENLDFWLAVEKYKRTRPLNKMATRAIKIFNEFISTTSTRQVNVDSSVREVTNQSLCRSPGPASFQLAQDQIYSLMESDSYPRFLKSRLYSQMANHNTQHTQTTNQNEPGSTVLTHENEAGSAHPTNRRRPASMVGQS